MHPSFGYDHLPSVWQGLVQGYRASFSKYYVMLLGNSGKKLECVVKALSGLLKTMSSEPGQNKVNVLHPACCREKKGLPYLIEIKAAGLEHNPSQCEHSAHTQISDYSTQQNPDSLSLPQCIQDTGIRDFMCNFCYLSSVIMTSPL